MHDFIDFFYWYTLYKFYVLQPFIAGCLAVKICGIAGCLAVKICDKSLNITKKRISFFKSYLHEAML